MNGVRIGLMKDYPSRLSNNNPSFSTAEKVGIAKQLEKWLKTGIVLGPFDLDYAYRNKITLHMLFGVPKPDGSTRPILNLSDKTLLNYSINNIIDPELCTVEYAQTKQVVETVRALGRNAWLWAKDLKDGYYNVSVNKRDVHKLGFMFDGKIYIFQRLPMGLSSSPNIFTEFMHFPIWAIKQDRPDLYYRTIDGSTFNRNNFIKEADIAKSGNLIQIATLFYYLDDILGGHPDEQEAQEQFSHSEKILQKLSLRTKEAKAKPPAQVQKWLGKIYDTRRQWLYLPSDKVQQYIAELKLVMSNQSITKRHLLSHIGRIRHMASIYKPLAAFARNLEIWAYSVKHLSHHIRMSSPLKEDIRLAIWAMKRAAEYGISFDQFLKPIDCPDIIIYTDAALNIGLGGYSNQGHWFKNNWKDINLYHDENRDIVWKELAAIFSFIHSLRHSLKGKVVHIYTDNEACKYMLIKMRAKLRRPDLQLLINELCKIFIEYEIISWIEHIPGKDNIIPDALSRNKDVPSDLRFKCTNRISTTSSIQLAADLCKNIVINRKHLSFD